MPSRRKLQSPPVRRPAFRSTPRQSQLPAPSLARRPAGDFAEDFAIESFLICRLAPDQRLAAMGFDAEGSLKDAWFLQVLDAEIENSVGERGIRWRHLGRHPRFRALL